jgi:hypothetical protein
MMMQTPLDTGGSLSALGVLDDVVLAVRSSSAVLVTAPSETAMDIARTIAVRCALPDVRLVHDVERLTPAQQASLMALLERAERRGMTTRIIATSSVCVYDRVMQGSFDDRLFYRLNAIHVVASGPRPPAADLARPGLSE